MRTPTSSGDGPGNSARARAVHAGIAQLDALRKGFQARLLPLTPAMLAACEAELRPRAATDPSPAAIADALAALSIARHHAVVHERRWQAAIGHAFAGWPRPPVPIDRGSGYSLVSDDELKAQLIGQPVIEALERRFVDVIDTIDSRLWSLAAALGGRVRPVNPFAPRVVVEAVLAAFPASEYDGELRQAMLRHYERLAGEGLGSVYAWINTELASGGFAMSGANDFTLLITQPAATTVVGEGRAHGALWGHDNALPPEASSWRGRGVDHGLAAPRASTRGDLLRERMRAVRDAGGARAAQRELGGKEFLSVLSLLQGNETPAFTGGLPVATGPALRDNLLQGAANLGISSDDSSLSDLQHDAVDVVGALFDGLRFGAVLAPVAEARLVRLAYPYLRLALDDTALFDDLDHPAMVALAGIVELWDGNVAGTDVDAELHALADEAADVIANGYHGDLLAFDRANTLLDAGTEALRRRAESAERRAWQSLLGRERLQAARAEADRLLQARVSGRRISPLLAEFLGDQWRQSLVHAWLRDGPDSPRFRTLAEVGDAMLRIDEHAAQARGHEVAEGLIAVEQPLRACYLACGLDQSGANALLAALIAELARPDGQRIAPDILPLAGEGAERGAPDVPPGPSALQEGQVVIARDADTGDVAWQRVAWISPLSGSVLLVNRQGMRQQVLAAAEAGAALAARALLPRPVLSPVESVLRSLAETALT